MRVNSRVTVVPLCVLLIVVALASLASAQSVTPYAIRGDKADVIADASPDATAHFSCELRPFNLSKGLFCYGPAAMRQAYGVDQLIASGKNGAGQTIVIIDAYGSPTLQADLAAFDTAFGLPAPPSLTVIPMPGLQPFDYTDGNQLGWAEETSLDVQWSHAMAPGANIVLVEAATNNDPDILAAQNYAITHHLGQIISESFGESETALVQSGKTGIEDLAENEISYFTARLFGMSVFVSAGDSGTAEADNNGNLIPTPAAAYPASSPNVTTVGGTNLFFGSATNANPNGTYQGEVVWNDGFGAGGGGISSVFLTPSYQMTLPRSTVASLNGHRGYPDVAYNAGVVGGVIAHLGFLGANSGYYIFGGTSAGAPQWSAITSIINQVAGHPVGFLNDRLYPLGRGGRLGPVMHDITIGDNGFAGITGYSATTGWDLATGWGSPNYGLVQLLAH